MFSIFEKEKLASAGMLVCLGLGILLRIWLGILYSGMIRETDNMASTNNRLLRQCKLKFANCFQLNNGVANIPVFVDKFISRLALGPFTFEGINHLSGQLVLLSAVFSGVGVCRSIAAGRMLGEILPFYIVSFFGLYLYFSVSSLVDLKGRRRILKINLVDYLENHLSARMDVTQEDMQNLFGKNTQTPRSASRRTVELMPISKAGERFPARDGERFSAKDGERFPAKDGERFPAKGGEGAGSGESAAGRRKDASAGDAQSPFSQASARELEELLQEFLTS